MSPGGRPRVGKSVEVRLPDDVLELARQQAEAKGLALAAYLRTLIVAEVREAVLTARENDAIVQAVMATARKPRLGVDT